MNLIDLFVTEVLSEPYFKYDMWCVKVKADGHGSISNQTIMCKTKEECLNIKKGYKFLG